MLCCDELGLTLNKMPSYTDTQTMSVLNVSVLSDHIRLYLKINSTQNKYENAFTFISE